MKRKENNTAVMLYCLLVILQNLPMFSYLYICKPINNFVSIAT